MQRAIKELYVTRGDIQAIGKISPLVTPLGGKVFWAGFNVVNRIEIRRNDRLSAAQ